MPHWMVQVRQLSSATYFEWMKQRNWRQFGRQLFGRGWQKAGFRV
jgi:hypothetical protein